MSEDVKKNADKIQKKPAEPARKGLPTAAWVCLCVVLLVAGVLAGHYLIPSASSLSLGGRSTLSEGELDSTIARYTNNGQTINVTARQVLDEAGALTANDDGTYNVPAASDVLTYAQNEIIFAEAEKRGITVSDDEVNEYAETSFGTSDFASIASSYNMEEDEAKKIIENYALMNKFRNSVATTVVPEKPAAPTEPEEGQEDVATADYASYIINLLGDEWDSETGTWARTDGDYYATLSGYEITNDSATYAAASAAYSVASSKYSTAYTQASSEWSTFATQLLANATIELGTLA